MACFLLIYNSLKMKEKWSNVTAVVSIDMINVSDLRDDNADSMFSKINFAKQCPQGTNCICSAGGICRQK